MATLKLRDGEGVKSLMTLVLYRVFSRSKESPIRGDTKSVNKYLRVRPTPNVRIDTKDHLKSFSDANRAIKNR